MFCSSCLPLSPETLTQNIETILKLYNTVFFYNSYWTNSFNSFRGNYSTYKVKNYHNAETI